MENSSEERLEQIENDLRDAQFSPSAGFSARVMQRIEEREVGFFRRLFMNIAINQRLITGSVATLGMAMICLIIANKTEGPIVTPTLLPSTKEIGPVVPETVSGYEDLRISPVLKGKAQDQSASASQHIDFGERVDEELAPTSRISELSKGATDSTAYLKSDDLDKLSASSVARAPSKQMPAAQSGLMGGMELDHLSIARPWQPPSNTEQYIHYSENQRVDALTNPVSTFGIDVDTASYANVRRMLQAGRLPPADAVRVEEFINYFEYSYPQQEDKAFTLSYEIAPSPLEQDKLLLKLGIKARDLRKTRSAWNLVFLVDVSGSMTDPGKLDLVKPTMKLIVNQMKEGDRIAIVTYAGQAGLEIDSSALNQKEKILSAIDALSAGGSTNGAGGIQLAYQIAERNRIENGVNRVILATDGDFNVGITSHEDLLRLIEQKRKGGVGLTTLGFGSGNLKDGSMEQLANKGNGNYFYIDSFREAGKVLDQDLVANMQTIAKDVKLQIEFNPQQVSQYRLVGYENRKLNREDFNNDTVDSGEIGSGHTVTALYEIVLAGSNLARAENDQLRYQTDEVPQKKVVTKPDFNSELAFLKIRFKEPSAESSQLLSFPIKSQDIRKKLSETSDDFRFAAAVAYFAQVLRGSSFVAGYSLKQVAELASGALAADARGLRHEFVDLVRSAERLKAAE